MLNSDVEVTANWLQPLARTFTKNDVAVAGPKINSYRDKNAFEYAGASGGYLDRHGYAFCRGRIFDVIESDRGQYDCEQSIAWASGCAMAVRADLFHRVGGFDDQFFAHYEEIDICWRLRRAGYRILCAPSSQIYHLGGGTMQYASRQKLFLNFRNSLYMLYKNLSGWKRFRKIFIRLVLDGVAAFVFLFEGKYAYIGAILDAHRDLYKNLSKLHARQLMETNCIDEMRIGPPITDGNSRKSIIWNFFLRNRKTFTSLFADEKA